MAKIRLDIDPVDKILLKRNLNKNGAGQKFFTHEVRRLSTPYVPRLRSGSGEKYRSDHSQCDHWRNRYHSIGT